MSASGQLSGNRTCAAEMVCMLCAVALWITGCGRGIERAAVSGSVSFAGKPVNEGSIRFVPRSGTPGGGMGVLIHEGKYQVSLQDRLAAGSYYVAITATRPTGRQIRRSDVKPGEPTMMPEVVQYIPSKYNDDLTLTLDLPAGETHHDFDLK